MIMPKGQQQLLLPARPSFIVVTLALALALDMLPLGRLSWTPSWSLLLLVFWGLHQPQRVGMVTAFVVGLCIDVHQSVLLGLHAMVYCAVMYGVSLAQRRLQWFGSGWQALQLLPLFAAVQLLELLLRILLGGIFPGWWLLLAPLLEALLWPLVSWLLLAPQRRPPLLDDNRPL